MKNNFLLFFILLFFLITRLYQIESVPASLYWDEASIAVNAYSVALTGRDEWGDLFPLHFRAFGEFKLPVYIYSVAVFEKFLGLSELAVRLPAVLFSFGTILLTYLLALKIFNQKTTALLSAFFLSILPWFFIFSRTGYEATAGLMFYILGIYLMLFTGQNRIWPLISVLSFAVSLYSYNSFRIITPLTFLCLTGYFIWIRRADFKKIALISLISIFVFLLSLVPIYRLTASEGTTRLQAVSIGNGEAPGQEIITVFLQNYISHFSPNFLFISGDANLRSQTGNSGQLYFVNLLLIVFGIVFVLKNRKPLQYLPILLMLFAPIPAAITKESPHALRAISGVPFLAILSAVGAVYFLDRVKFRRLFLCALVVGFLVMFAVYFKSFLTEYPNISSKDWQYGYKKIFTEFTGEFGQFERIIVSDYMAQPYIFVLYYLKIDPAVFLSSVEYNPVDKWGFSTVASFDKFQFKPVDRRNLPQGKVLIFASPLEKLDIEEKSVIYNLDGSTAFYVYDYQQK
ncbi:hypothetical protein A3A14_00910 [Candidatus Daviesbacteria bacterium RIFCSPLOWO2_01_FULL_43_38]|uniref:Glycosyltransferase RgtA/B/C/D-like domain-containing protein n=3 Tax=Candidatus Daviesiibacteriota TaxID=1752718 RepID=A0A1F5K6V5_9BACT|nr:MAG: hypothetical protein UV33_C0010G0002 [Candidatus Daviesbacteria bacterium GW2011_GWA1_42_6]KKS71228.1 MAG: hypothetical protein UV41_C0003G0013 [Candidatus Daviesbacteria bacterium GW2011_GWA2_42_7]OGE36480.1 MAG: hypothetical protein A3E45_00990 [Candidatus Daviesbacteria bacterium RIFCSPHIGHO2_12_FULL_43_11]OGE63525.1 MAG: hypothetical protein A3A14_00910 [Candidatus Daviesbacteria bacterium RIFCSPLOWO2_01_FULL_43_38]